MLAPELVPHGPQVLCKHHAAPGLHEQGRVSPGLRMNEQSRLHYLPPAPSFPQAAIGKAPQPSQLGHFVLLAACTTATYRASGSSLGTRAAVVSPIEMGTGPCGAT